MSKKAIEVIVIDDTDSEEEVDSSKTIKQQTNNKNNNKPSSSTKISGSSSASKRDLSKVDNASSSKDSAVKKAKVSSPTVPLTRLEMEKERLERIKKLEASGQSIKPIFNIIPTKPHVNMPKLNTISDTPDTSNDSGSGSSFSNSWNSKKSGSSSNPGGQAVYLKGEIKRVFNTNSPNDGGMKFSELVGPKNGKLGKDHPTVAIISSYALDMMWVADHFQEDTSLLLVNRRDESKSPKLSQIVVEAKTTNLFLLYPDISYGAMHVKCAILCYDNYMRVVIPTANFVAYDWDTMDNAFFIQDFPILSNIDPTIAHPKNNPSHTPLFSLALFEFLQRLEVPKLFLKSFLIYDFKSSVDVRLVVSCAGYWNEKEGKFRLGGGIIGLAEVVKSFKFKKEGKWQLEASGSSLGGLDNFWLAQFLAAASGISPASYFSKDTPLPPSNISGSPRPTDKNSRWNAPIKIIFPTLANVDRSINGRPGGGTLFCAKKLWETQGFPQHLFHKGDNKGRSRILAHTKMISAIKKITAQDDEATFKHEGWVYVGSHNFTKAAWGKLQNSSNQPQLAISNYEMGVVMPVVASSASALEQSIDKLMSFTRPLVPYDLRGGDIPWMQFTYLTR